MDNLKKWFKNNPKIKRIAYSIMMNDVEARPRLWLRLLQFAYTKRGKNSKIYSSARKDITPFNKFVLGKRSVIESFVCVNNAVGEIIIGDNCRVGLHSTVIGPVRIGDNTIIAQSVVLSGLNHTYTDPNIPIANQEVSKKEIVIEEDVWICANATITSGVRVGKHSVIAAGAVVSTDVPPYSIAAGIPAKVIKTYNHESGKWESVKK